ncbi:MAG TPA: hypothetical protein PLX69_18295 [Leptospiraceae bacterium]|nr:hypothetical protein [Leptospiraceae bacterium]HRG76516.1 hypothetical protein [Leptospiraceae bacterium]
MKNYFLTKDLLQELIYGEKAKKARIVLKLEELLKKNESLFTSIISVNHILEKEIDIDKRKLILRNINLVCEKILSLDNEDLPLTLAMESEFSISHDIAVDLMIATKSGMDSILDTTEKFRFQKMISVVSLILESK